MNGILFKPWKIKAIADNPDMEWQFREVIKPQPVYERGVLRWIKSPNKIDINMDDHADLAILYARYKVGELVYIKEAHKLWASTDYGCWKVEYKDGVIEDCNCVVDPETDNSHWFYELAKWRSPLFMPAWAARYFIRMTGVEAQRLQEISIDDCKAEGIHGYTLAKGCLSDNPPDQRWKFIELWNTINPKYPWDSNCWVFKYRFKLEAKAES